MLSRTSLISTTVSIVLFSAAIAAETETDTYFYENSLAPSPGSCPLGTVNATLNPEVTQGPYYLDELLFRTDITEGEGGVPLEARITVLDTSCLPVVGAYIDVWHCNATGIYSGYTSNNAGGTLAPASDASSRKLLQGGMSTGAADNFTFLRGTVQTDANGVAVVKSIVPGWYSGRVTHMHAMIHITEVDDNEEAEYEESRTVHTGQFYFEEELLDAVYGIYPYSRHTGKRTALAEDSVFASGGSDPTQIFVINYVSPADLSAGLVASVTAVVDPSANHTTTFSMGGGMGPGMGAPGGMAPGINGGVYLMPLGPIPSAVRGGFPQAGRRLLRQGM